MNKNADAKDYYRPVKIVYTIEPKDEDEYRDVIDAISDWLGCNGVKHKKEEIVEQNI